MRGYQQSYSMAKVPPMDYPGEFPSCPPAPTVDQGHPYHGPPPYYYQGGAQPVPQPPAYGVSYPGAGTQPPVYTYVPTQPMQSYSGAMPPAQGGLPPPSYNQYPQVNNQKKQKQKGGLFGILDDVTRGLDSAARDVGKFAGKAFVGDSMKLLRTGNVVQFYYTKTGRTLQIIRHPLNGALIADVGGYLSPQAYNAHWFVFQEHESIIKLYNQDNFLGVHNGSVILIKAQNPVTAPGQTRWKVHQSLSSEKVISLESLQTRGLFLTVASDDCSLSLERSNTLSSNTYLNIQFVTSTAMR